MKIHQLSFSGSFRTKLFRHHFWGVGADSAAPGRFRSQPRRGAAPVIGTANLGEHHWFASAGPSDSTADRLQFPRQVGSWQFSIVLLYLIV